MSDPKVVIITDPMSLKRYKEIRDTLRAEGIKFIGREAKRECKIHSSTQKFIPVPSPRIMRRMPENTSCRKCKHFDECSRDEFREDIK